jgi:undecaprenyl-diphosphatase
VLRGIAGQDQDGRALGLAILVAFLPAALVGLTLGPAIETYLFGAWPVVIAWAVGGVVLLVYDSHPSRRTGMLLEQLTLRGALLIGLAQCVALWPGVSRSLATILGGLAAGLSLGAAVEFSFLLGLITLGAATVYKALDSGAAMAEAYGPLELGLGFAAAALSALVAVRWMVAWLSQRGLAIFGWWRLAAALVVGAMLVTGYLEETTDGTDPDPLLEPGLVPPVPFGTVPGT